jgi:hypothetical protein
LFFSYLDYWRFYQFVQLFGLLTIFLIFVFQLCGLALLIPGLLVVVNEDVINDEVLPALKSISIASSNLGDLAKSLSISLIVIGSFVLIVSVVGACGACYEIRCCLIIVSIHSRSIVKIIIIILLITMSVYHTYWGDIWKAHSVIKVSFANKFLFQATI